MSGNALIPKWSVPTLRFMKVNWDAVLANDKRKMNIGVIVRDYGQGISDNDSP